jgi:DNA mismatch endonuclease, patch repair protein
LPGRPDIVFRKRRKVIFVHGCFWHQHGDKRCHLRSRPKSNLHYWQPKLRRNVVRDRNNTKQLASIGWNILVIWECELREVNNLETRLLGFLGP